MRDSINDEYIDEDDDIKRTNDISYACLVMSTITAILCASFTAVSVAAMNGMTAKTVNDISERVEQLDSEIENMKNSREEIYEKHFEELLELAEKKNTVIVYIEKDGEPETIPEEAITVTYDQPVYISDGIDKERLPSGMTNMYRCMDYRSLTNHGSEQWQLQMSCYTDSETGIRYLPMNGEKYYCAALGSAYGQTIGDAFHVTLKNGYEFNIVYGDFKNPYGSTDTSFFGQPDTNYDGQYCTSVIEFIFDEDAAPDIVMQAGTMSVLERFGGLHGDGGNITDICYIGKVW